MDITLPFLSWLSVLVVAGALIAAAISDFRSLTIPNWCPVTVAAFYAPFAYTLDIPATGHALHYGLGALIYLIGLGLTSRGVIGGGDVKLLAATAIWTGPGMILQFLLSVAVVGGVIALIAVCARTTLLKKPRGWEPWWLSPTAGSNAGIPYGMAISVVGLVLIGQIPGLK